MQYLLPFFFEGVMGYQTYVAGLLLAIPSVALMILGPISGTLSDKIGSRVLATGAAAFASVTFFFISYFTENTSILYIAVTLLCVGIALGIFFPPNMNQILGQSKKDEEGVGSSIMTTMKNVGETVGIALMGTIRPLYGGHKRELQPQYPGGADPDGDHRRGLCGRVCGRGRDCVNCGGAFSGCKGCTPVTCFVGSTSRDFFFLSPSP